jgi:hypothetical protein
MDQPSIDTLSDFDMFFYYGQNDLDLETRHDIMLNVMQPKRSLLGNRSLDAAGVQDYENTPVGINQQIKLPFDIVESISRRNQYVSNGENGTKDRRVAVSQSSVRVESDNLGNVSITVLYIPMANFKQTEVLIPLGIGV